MLCIHEIAAITTTAKITAKQLERNGNQYIRKSSHYTEIPHRSNAERVERNRNEIVQIHKYTMHAHTHTIKFETFIYGKMHNDSRGFYTYFQLDELAFESDIALGKTKRLKSRNDNQFSSHFFLLLRLTQK